MIRDRASITAIFLCAAASAAALVIPTDALAERLAHPVRVAALGALPPTTVEGALWLRIALGIAPWLVVAAIWSGARLAVAGGNGEPRSTSTVTPQEWIVLALLAIVGGLLRVIHLNESLWYDEIAGLLGYSIHGPLVVAGNYFSQANHPLSQILIWGSCTLLGVDEFAVRLPSFAAGVATIPALWLLGRTARGPGFGLLMATVGALMPVAVLASTDGRGYALVILLATLSAWLLLRALERPTRGALAAYAIVTGLLVYAHLAAVCVPLAQGIVLVALLGKDPRRAGAALQALCAAAVVALALHAPLLPDLFARREAFRTTSADQPGLVGIETSRALLAWGGSWTWWAATPGLLLAAIGATSLRREPRIGFALAITGLGVPLAYLLATLADSWLYARFLLFAVPAAAILMAAGLGVVARAGRLPLALAAGLVAAASGIEVLRLPPRQPLRDAVALAAAPIDTRPPSVAGLGLNDQVLLLYANAIGLPVADLGLDGVTIRQRLARLGPDRVIVLYPDFRPDERVGSLRDAGYAPTTTLPGWIDWGAGRVELWERFR